MLEWIVAISPELKNKKVVVVGKVLMRSFTFFYFLLHSYYSTIAGKIPSIFLDFTELKEKKT